MATPFRFGCPSTSEVVGGGATSIYDVVVLADILRSVEAGMLPPTDGRIEIVPAPAERISAVVCFTGHIVVAADVEESWVRDQLPDGDLSAALNPPFLHALEQRLNRRVNCLDMVTSAAPLDGPPPVALTEVAELDHPRVRRAQRYRDSVRVWTAYGGVLVMGCGLAGRLEAAIEVDPDARGTGLGRALAIAARHLVPHDRRVWAQIAPGNAASVRTFLGAGFTPVGSEALLVPLAYGLATSVSSALP